jgi:hypothetical protein
MYNRKRQPATQIEIINSKPIQPESRANEVRRDNDINSELKIGLYDIDFAIKYYFDNIIRPTINDNGTSLQVPVMYGAPEKWKNVRADGFMRDKNGKILCPLISYRRTAIEKNRNLGSKVDANTPAAYYTTHKTYTKENRYDQFSILTNQKPQETTYRVVVPEYVNITYDLLVWTDYVEQMNGLLEAILYSEGSFWGDKDRFKFRTKVDNITTVTDLQSDNDRLVRSTFSMTVFGYIVPDALVKKLSNLAPEKTTGVNPNVRTNSSLTYESETEANASGSL